MTGINVGNSLNTTALPDLYENILFPDIFPVDNGQALVFPVDWHSLTTEDRYSILKMFIDTFDKRMRLSDDDIMGEASIDLQCGETRCYLIIVKNDKSIRGFMFESFEYPLNNIDNFEALCGDLDLTSNKLEQSDLLMHRLIEVEMNPDEERVILSYIT